MWIVYRSNNKDDAQTLMLDTGKFRKIGGMPYPFEYKTDAEDKVKEWSQREPDWKYEVRWFGR